METQAKQISRLNAELVRLRARLPWAPLETFDTFLDLPLEIRCEIWSYALPGPRLLTIGLEEELLVVYVDRDNGDKTRSRGSGFRNGATAFRKMNEISIRKMPAIFHVCRESRRLALTAYEFCLSTSVSAASIVTQIIWVPAPDRLGSLDHKKRSALPWLRESVGKEAKRRIVPHSDITHTGVRFRPACDTIYLRSDCYAFWSILTDAEATELKTENIQSLAIHYGTFEQMPFRLLGYDTPLFGGLRELIIIVEEHDEGELIRRNISVSPGVIQEQIERYQQELPHIRFPNVKVMTEAMLVEYVEGCDKTAIETRDDDEAGHNIHKVSSSETGSITAEVESTPKEPYWHVDEYSDFIESMDERRLVFELPASVPKTSTMLALAELKVRRDWQCRWTRVTNGQAIFGQPDFSKAHHIEAVMIYERGVERTGRERCFDCSSGNGISPDCVVMSASELGSAPVLTEACSNCVYRQTQASCNASRRPLPIKENPPSHLDDEALG